MPRVSDFFGIGHELTTQSQLGVFLHRAAIRLQLLPADAVFAKTARITLSNEGPSTVAGIYLRSASACSPSPLAVALAAARGVAARVPRIPPRRRDFILVEAKGEGRLVGVIIYHIVKPRLRRPLVTRRRRSDLHRRRDRQARLHLRHRRRRLRAPRVGALAPGRGPHTGCPECHPGCPASSAAEGIYAFEPHGLEQHDGGRYSMYRFFVTRPDPFHQLPRLTFGTAANESAYDVLVPDGAAPAILRARPAGARALFRPRINKETLLPLSTSARIHSRRRARADDGRRG